MGIKPTMFKGVYLGLPLKIKVAQKNQVCEAMSLKQYELTKEQWERIKPLSPPEETGKWGRPRKDNRIMLNGMLWIIRSGAQWCELLKRSEPAGVPCWKTGPMVPDSGIYLSPRDQGPAMRSRPKATFPVPSRLTGICIKIAFWWSVFPENQVVPQNRHQI